jgi:hypothetical protein
MSIKPNRLDWLIYKIFWWRWNRIFRENPQMREFFRDYWNMHARYLDEEELK